MTPLLLVWSLLLSVEVAACSGGLQQNFANRRESRMKIEVNDLSVDFSVTNVRIKKAEDLEVRIVFTNTSQKQLRLNALFLDFTTIILKVRRPDGKAVNPGPPPLPPIDDGQTGRIDLAPSQ